MSDLRENVTMAKTRTAVKTKMQRVENKVRIRSSLAREALAEFLGTFILLSFGDGSVAQSVLSKGSLGLAQSIHWSWGIGVTMGIYVAGGVSGAHLNPAVSVAQALLGRLPWLKVPVYCLAQYLGAFVASCCVYLVYYDALKHYDGGVRSVLGDQATAGIWSTYPQTYVSTWNCFGDQIFGTGLLLVCILAITDPRNMAPSKGITALSVGLSVVAIGMTFGLNCGYAINPARDLGPRIFTAIAGWGTEPFSVRDYNYFWVPVVGPHLGAIVGALVYQLCVGFHWPQPDDDPGGNDELNVNVSKNSKLSVVSNSNEPTTNKQGTHSYDGPYTTDITTL